MGVPGLEIWEHTMEHPGPHQHMLVTTTDPLSSMEGRGSSNQEGAAGILFGCLERLWLRDAGMGGRRVPQEWQGLV